MKELILILLGIVVFTAGLTFSLSLGIAVIRVIMYMINKLEDKK